MYVYNYPKVIQLPLTLKCNSKCVMCNVWNMNHSNEMSLEEFSQYIQDPIFKKVESVGINGGEPTLIKDLISYVIEILKLPSLKYLNIISNGFKTHTLLNVSREIYKKCIEKNISFHISISLDGYSNIHDDVRGIKNSFYKTINSIDSILKEQHIYCDTIDIGCTIVNQNINNLIELDTFAKMKNYKIKYRLGIKNNRIESQKLIDNFSVIYSKRIQTALEFFHYKMNTSTIEEERFKYFSIFYWLNNETPTRLLGCDWKKDGITLDGHGNLYYCAVESKKIGSFRVDTGENIFFNKRNLQYRDTIIKEKCNNCIHDYSGKINKEAKLKYYEYYLHKKYSMEIYRIKVKET